MASKFDEALLEVSSLGRCTFDNAVRIIFYTIETPVPPESSKEILKNIAVNAMHPCDRKKAVELLVSNNHLGLYEPPLFNKWLFYFFSALSTYSPV